MTLTYAVARPVQWRTQPWIPALSCIYSLDFPITILRNQVSPKQFQMFELYVLRDWPVSKVAQTLSVNAGQVYLAKHRISSLLKKERARLESQA